MGWHPGNITSRLPPRRLPSLPRQKPTAPAPRAETKGATIIDLIGSVKGSTLAEIMTHLLAGPHGARVLSTASKKRGLKIESAKGDDVVRNSTINN